jgi:hypothetical protein
MKTEIMQFDEYYMRVLLNCALGMINDVSFGDMFLAVETNSEFIQSQEFEVSAEQIAAVVYVLVEQLVQGDRSGIKEVLDTLQRIRTMELKKEITGVRF